MKYIILKIRKIRVILTFTLAAIFFSASFAPPAYARQSFDTEGFLSGIIGWEKSQAGVSGALLSGTFLQSAGAGHADWIAFGLGRTGHSDDYAAYLSKVTADINARYMTADKLSRSKSTEWHRISLAVLAAGGNPAAIGSCGGKPINLIADGTYNRGLTASVGVQGINGWIWGLIALDSKMYEVPQDAHDTRQDFITEILKRQLEDGGFALSGSTYDTDITAMAVQALSPYYNSETVFDYIPENIEDESGSSAVISKTVRQAVDESIALLSAVQNTAGDYSDTQGAANLKSTAWVLNALLSLGIDPFTDCRFIKNGNTIPAAIAGYQNSDGGFLHKLNAQKSESMAGEQALYSLAGLLRFQNGMRNLFDMRTEFTDREKQVIAQAEESIGLLTAAPTLQQVQDALEAYRAVPELDRRYVRRYYLLSAQIKRLELQPLVDDLIFSGDRQGEGALHNIPQTAEGKGGGKSDNSGTNIKLTAALCIAGLAIAGCVAAAILSYKKRKKANHG